MGLIAQDVDGRPMAGTDAGVQRITNFILERDDRPAPPPDADPEGRQASQEPLGDDGTGDYERVDL